MEKSGFANRKCLVTGATGFIGRNLVKRLLEEGAEVSVFVLDEEYSLSVSLPTYRGNIQNFSDIQRAISRFQPELVFHLAAQPIVDTALRSVLDTLNTNIQGSQNLLHACLEIEDKLKGILFVSTDKVYGNTHYANEECSLAGIEHPYNASKVCADILAQMYNSVFNLPIAIVRSGNVYGEGDLNFDRIIPYSIRQVLRGESIVLRSNGQSKRDYIYVDDIVDGYLAVIKALDGWSDNLIVNFGSHEPKSVVDVVNTVFSVSEKAVDIEIKDSAVNELDYQHLNWNYAKEFGWHPKTSFEEGIRKTIEWHKEYSS